MKVRITWSSRYTGHTDHGDWFSATSRKMLEDWIAIMSMKHPYINHWIEGMK